MSTISIPALLQERRADQKKFPPFWVPFPPCSDVLLSHPHDGGENVEIRDLFREYFSYGHLPRKPEDVDPELLACLQPVVLGPREGEAVMAEPAFPPPWCLPPSCVMLGGLRGDGDPRELRRLHRLFAGDVIWLYFMERMGVFRMLGAILDDYATRRRFPFRADRPSALILEAMVRQTAMGTSSRVGARDAAYRAILGWTTPAGRTVGNETLVNQAFSTHFHRFLQLALELYRDRRLAVAIQNAPTVRSSVATLKAISETIDVLHIAFDPFKYGRNYQNTQAGIVWAVAGLLLIRDLRSQLGIQAEYEQPSRYIQAAHDLLLGGAAEMTQGNRYTLHKECADKGRNLALDLEVVNYKDANPGGELEAWLNAVEDDVEGYRTAYKALTGVDLGEPGRAAIEQEV